MKNILLLVCLSTSLGYAQTFTLSPEKPEGAKPIQIAYQSTPALLAKGALTCKVHSLGFYRDASGDLQFKKTYDVPLTGKGNAFTGTFTPDTTARALIFSFRYGDVEIEYDEKTNRFMVSKGYIDVGNDKLSYSSLIFQRDGVARQFGYWLLANAALGPYLSGIKEIKGSLDLYKDLVKTEFTLYPSSIDVFFRDLYIPYISDTVALKKVFRQQTERLFATGLTKPGHYKQLISFLYRLNLANELDYFTNEMNQKFTPAELADGFSLYQDSISSAPQDKKIAVADRCIKWYERKMDLASKIYANRELGLSIDGVKKQRILAFLDTNPAAFESEFAKEKFERSYSLLNTDIDLKVLDALVKINPERAKVWANQGIAYYNDVLANWQEHKKTVAKDPKNFDLFPNEVKANLERTVYRFYSRLSGLYFDANPAMALDYATKSEKILTKELREYGRYDEAVLNQLSTTINKALPADEAKLRFEKMVKNDTWNKQTVNYLKDIFLKQGGDESMFKSYIDGLLDGEKEMVKKELQAQLTKKPAPAFAFEKMEGGFVTKDDLKGKTVIIDFWATWCGPCIASMPMMQKLMNSYKADPSVVFLFISTNEKGEREKIISKIKKVLADRSLAIPVYYDFNGKSYTQFGLQILPTKIFIDKEGLIRYTAIGGDNDERKSILKASTLIELIK